MQGKNLAFLRVLERQQENGLQIETKPFAPVKNLRVCGKKYRK